MRWITIFFVACLALAALRAVLIVLLLLLGLSLLWGVLMRPGETLAFLLFAVFAAVLQTHTVAVLVLIGFLGVALILLPTSSGEVAGDP